MDYLWKPEEYQRLYNCSFYKIEEIPLEKRQHIFLGISFILLFFLFEFLYIPCLLTIRKNLEHSCFKIMFYMGISDILALFICGLLTGILGIYGAVFCSFPTLIFIAGVFARVFWYNETLCAIMLAMNRCLEMALPSLAKPLFAGRKTWFCLTIPFLYALICGLPLGPILFSGIEFSWFYNPHVGYVDDDGGIYENHLIDTINSAMLFCLLPTSYILFSIILVYRYCAMNGHINTALRQKKIFIQVLLISSLNMTTVFIIAYMQQFFHINEYAIYAGMIAWFFAHGLKPVIYLSLNSKIRQDVTKMICGSPPQNRVFVNSTPNGNNNANRGPIRVGTV